MMTPILLRRAICALRLARLLLTVLTCRRVQKNLKRPAGSYAKLADTGHYGDMKDAYRWLYGVWLPNSGHEISQRPCVEAYLNSPVDTKPQDLPSNIYLPVEVRS